MLVEHRLWGGAPTTIDDGIHHGPIPAGTHVQAYWRGHGRAFPCVVLHCHEGPAASADHVLRTYDVRYDDGTRERGVREKLIVVPSASAHAGDGLDASEHDSGAVCRSRASSPAAAASMGHVSQVVAARSNCYYFTRGVPGDATRHHP